MYWNVTRLQIAEHCLPVAQLKLYQMLSSHTE